MSVMMLKSCYVLCSKRLITIWRKHNTAYDMQSQGFDKLSSDLQDSLDNTEYEISHNADKQLEIINSMLDKAVSSYQEAYGKINSIIKNTG